MTQPFAVHLNWEGAETIATIASVLHQPCHIELNLAANYHHAIFSHLHPDARPAQLEALDEQGGAELLAKLAEIEGLQPLARLRDAVAESKGSVRISAPAMVIIDIPEKR